MKKINTLRCLFISAQLLLAGQVAAQGLPDSLLLVRHQVYGASWTETHNPVWLSDQSLPDFAEAGLQYQNLYGSFRRPQEALRHQQTGFGANGLQSYRKWRFQGSVAYQKLADDSVKYSYAARPYNGNPFMVADLTGGNWKGDRLQAQLQLAAPRFGKWTLGLGIDYEAEQSARQNEPRPLYRYINYRINPVIAYAIDAHHKLSLSGAITGVNEVVEIGAYSRNNPLLYTIRGYGYATVSPVVTAERLSRGTGWEAGADYQYRKSHTAFFLSARYGMRREDVSDGYANMFIGGLDESQGAVTGIFERHATSSGWSAQAKGWFRDGTGYDESQRAINPAYYLSGLDGRLSWWKRKGESDLIFLQFRPSIRYMNYYEQIAETDLTSVMAGATANLAYRHQLSKVLSLTATPMLGYYHNLSRELTINAAQLMSDLVTRRDYAYLTTNYVNAGLSALADFRKDRIHYRFGIGYDAAVPTSRPKNDAFTEAYRNQLNATCTILF